jgi:E3 ubiquitin-protein ligase RGLG
MIVAIDATKSNTWKGSKTFGGRCLHAVDPHSATDPEDCVLNPYERVIQVVGRTLKHFDDDLLIPTFVFGDSETRDRSVRSLRPDGRDCSGFEDLMAHYRSEAPRWELSGPTSFAAAIRAAIAIVRRTKQFHLLLIVADGELTSEHETIKAVQEASNYPLAIVAVGVGDGPWGQLEMLDDRIPDRKFDNFQFVNFHKVEREYPKNFDPAFALHALMELPDQFKACRKLALF